MRYSGIIKNDTANCPGIAVSLYVQGCSHHCKNCFNPETWEPSGGKKFTAREFQEIIEAITANGIQRNFCILGGDPLMPYNRNDVLELTKQIKNIYPNIKIYLWTGYLYEEIDKKYLKYIDYLIDGPFIEAQKDLTLQMRGSRNQRIFDLTKKI